MTNVLSSDLRHYDKLFMALEYIIIDKSAYIIVFNGIKMESNPFVYDNVKYILTSHPTSCILTSRKGG